MKDGGDHEVAKVPGTGGSLTALPIIETQAGDVSAYIPTNVISITDGRSSSRATFFSGASAPPSTSASRCRASAATRRPPHEGDRRRRFLRLTLAQYREMAAFAQFASDLDKASQDQPSAASASSRSSKQGQYVPLGVEFQIAILYAANRGKLDKYAVKDLGRYEQELYGFLREARRPAEGDRQPETKPGKKDGLPFHEGLDKALDAFDAQFKCEPTGSGSALNAPR